ncbi:LysR family transcriptional regulator [Uliginosibacterium sediminicola]|uniref:LysR family transcriptional regulator n=1 Tax=Uliginosibacterium sediminicola TaxID=2024550 RepID=A0ABU9YTU9_9RHOO
MNFKQLEVFKTIMEAGSTNAAVNVLGLSQSAISRQLSALEEEIGLQLFLRDKGRLVPRPEAYQLIEEVEEISQGVSRLRNKISDARSGSAAQGLVRAALPSSMANTMLPPVLAAFMKAHPRVTVEVLCGPYADIERMVHNRVASFGFVRLPTEDRSFSCRPITRSSSSCVIPRKHPLAARPSIELADLAACDLILLGRQRVNRNELEHNLRREVSGYRCRLEVHSVETACACAAQGLGIAIVPTMIARYFSQKSIVIRPFLPDSAAEYGIITLPGVPLSRAAQALIDSIEQALAKGSAAEQP